MHWTGAVIWPLRHWSMFAAGFAARATIGAAMTIAGSKNVSVSVGPARSEVEETDKEERDHVHARGVRGCERVAAHPPEQQEGRERRLAADSLDEPDSRRVAGELRERRQGQQEVDVVLEVLRARQSE